MTWAQGPILSNISFNQCKTIKRDRRFVQKCEVIEIIFTMLQFYRKCHHPKLNTCHEPQCAFDKYKIYNWDIRNKISPYSDFLYQNPKSKNCHHLCIFLFESFWILVLFGVSIV